MALMGLMGVLPINPIMPINPINAQDTNNLFLHVDGASFFIDNEYFGDRLSGYTLPGFVLQPKVEWKLTPEVALTGGLHWLHYWGARDYPATTAYGAYPLYDSTSQPFHILPWLQVRMRLSNQWEFTLGSLYGDTHGLPMPLYNEELALVGDPEAGFELAGHNNWMTVDVWADWREYIWDRSPVPERFTAGLSGNLHLYGEHWNFYLPLHFVVQHEGGQNMSVSHNINNNFNAAAGLGLCNQGPVFNCYFDLYFDLSCRVMWYHQHGNAAVPFSNGWGIYPALSVTDGLHYKVNASYWYGKDFVPLLGSWHYSNLSANTAGLTFDRTRVITLQASWFWNDPSWPSKCRLLLYGTLYHYLPSTGTFADGTTQEYGHRNQFSVGATVMFCPTIKLH